MVLDLPLFRQHIPREVNQLKSSTLRQSLQDFDHVLACERVVTDVEFNQKLAILVVQVCYVVVTDTHRLEVSSLLVHQTRLGKVHDGDDVF